VDQLYNQLFEMHILKHQQQVILLHEMDPKISNQNLDKYNINQNLFTGRSLPPRGDEESSFVP
jgi:hypothetical protein